MKIAIFGAHKVGKTTLAEDLLDHLPGYTLMKEPYYELEESGYLFSEIPDADDFIAQFDYSVNQIEECPDNVIFDRCPLDILAYIHAVDKNRNIESLFETMREVLSAIDLLVFVPIEEPDFVSCQQSDLPKLRDKVNDILVDWMDDLGIDVIEVNGSVSERREQLLKRKNK
jgi:predicted ATPase